LTPRVRLRTPRNVRLCEKWSNYFDRGQATLAIDRVLSDKKPCQTVIHDIFPSEPPPAESYPVVEEVTHLCTPGEGGALAHEGGAFKVLSPALLNKKSKLFYQPSPARVQMFNHAPGF
jgi:hypothetical protein